MEKLKNIFSCCSSNKDAQSEWDPSRKTSKKRRHSSKKDGKPRRKRDRASDNKDKAQPVNILNENQKNHESQPLLLKVQNNKNYLGNKEEVKAVPPEKKNSTTVPTSNIMNPSPLSNSEQHQNVQSEDLDVLKNIGDSHHLIANTENGLRVKEVDKMFHEQRNNSAPIIYKNDEQQQIKVKRAPRLLLVVQEGQALPQDTQIKMNPQGVENVQSQRIEFINKNQEEVKVLSVDQLNNNNNSEKENNNRDFCTYFGSYNANDYKDDQSKLDFTKLNDVLLPKNEGFGLRHFLVRFNVDKSQYALKDLGEGTGTFIKVEQQYILKNGHIISFGDTHMVIGLVLEKIVKGDDQLSQKFKQANNLKSPQQLPLQTQLVIQFIDGPKAKQTFNYKQEQAPIFIGRSHDCTVCFREGNLSRVQCRIDFIDDKWLIKDGDGTKKSTNGTWLFAGDDEKIYDGMVFKAGHSLFKFQLVQEINL